MAKNPSADPLQPIAMKQLLLEGVIFVFLITVVFGSVAAVVSLMVLLLTPQGFMLFGLVNGFGLGMFVFGLWVVHRRRTLN